MVAKVSGRWCTGSEESKLTRLRTHPTGVCPIGRLSVYKLNRPQGAKEMNSEHTL